MEDRDYPMNYEVLEAIGQLAREQEIDRATLVETLQEGLVLAAKKHYTDAKDLTATIDVETGDVTVTLVRTVVPEVANREREISLEEARKIKPDAQLHEEIRVPVALNSFGRAAIQAAKQIVFQKVREARREKVYREFRDRVGSLVTGTVQHVDRGNVVVAVNGVEALLPARLRVRREQHSQGDTVRAVVVEASNLPHGPQVVLSRIAPELVSALFALESPEIREGIVRIEAIAREAGVRTKIAVSSRETRVDPVGACVGVKGVRVQAVVRELGGERMDIVPYTSDPGVYIARSLSPARIEKVMLNEKEKKATVLVPDDQLSIAIGKGGQNVRLASRLTGWSIDLLSVTQYEEQLGAKRVVPLAVTQLPGVGPKTARRLEVAGFETVQDVATARLEDLMAVPGVGKAKARKLRDEALRLLGEAQSHGDQEERPALQATPQASDEAAQVQEEPRPPEGESGV